MAAIGSTPIKLYGTNTASQTPLAANLANDAGGIELAVNGLDGKLFYKDNSGNVQVLASKATGAIGGSTTQVQFNNSGVLGGSANLTFNGTTLTAAGLAGPLNGTVGAITPAAGSFTTVGASGAVTLSGGTANGVTYLDGSKVLTSGSALTFDGTNLGVGTSSPVYKLDVANTIKVFSSTQSNICFGVAGADVYAKLEYDDTNGNFSLNNTRAYPIRFLTNNTERMRIDSSGTVNVVKNAKGTVTTANAGSFDMSLSNNFLCTPTGGVTLTFTNITAGQSGNIVLVNGSNYTIAKASAVKVASGVLTALSATGSYWMSYYSPDGTNVYLSTTAALS